MARDNAFACGAVYRDAGNARVARGVAKGIAGSQTVNMRETGPTICCDRAKQSWMVVAPGVWIAIVLAVIAAVVLRRTVFGRRVFALVRMRPPPAPVHRYRSFEDLHYALAVCCSVSSVMQMSRLRQGDPTVPLVWSWTSLPGGNWRGSLSGGEGSILGSMIGALIMAFLRNGCQQVVGQLYSGDHHRRTDVFAVAIDRWRHSRMVAPERFRVRTGAVATGSSGSRYTI